MIELIGWKPSEPSLNQGSGPNGPNGPKAKATPPEAVKAHERLKDGYRYIAICLVFVAQKEPKKQRKLANL